MCGLIIIKYLRNISDESMVEQFSENAYYQYFCRYMQFAPKFPCAASELVHFRKRIGGKGMELYGKVLKQTRTSKNKIYSRHEANVECISKGKEHKKYEFGNKVSIIYADRGG